MPTKHHPPPIQQFLCYASAGPPEQAEGATLRQSGPLQRKRQLAGTAVVWLALDGELWTGVLRFELEFVWLREGGRGEPVLVGILDGTVPNEHGT